jgi:endonuclease YncB( thermonuclease family)
VSAARARRGCRSARIAAVAAILALVLGCAACRDAIDIAMPIRQKLAPGTHVAEVAAGPAVVIDGRTLDVAGRRFQLYGVDAPDPDQTCEDAAKKDYPCGLMARDFLARLAAGGPARCTPREPNALDFMMAVCAIGGVDLAQALIDAGWAIADRGRSLYYEDSELAARAKKIGLWQGPFVTPQEWRNGERVPASRSLNEGGEKLAP